MRSQRLIGAPTGAARPEAPEAKEPCPRSDPACGPQRSDEGAERGPGMQADTLLRSLRSKQGVRAWHVFLPKGPEGDRFSAEKKQGRGMVLSSLLAALPRMSTC